MVLKLENVCKLFLLLDALVGFHFNPGSRRIRGGKGLFEAVAGLLYDIPGHGHDGGLRGDAVVLQNL